MLSDSSINQIVLHRMVFMRPYEVKGMVRPNGTRFIHGPFRIENLLFNLELAK